MDITASLLLADAGAVLTWGVPWGGSHLEVIGVILMTAGIIVFIAPPVFAGSGWGVFDRVRSRGGNTIVVDREYGRSRSSRHQRTHVPAGLVHSPTGTAKP